MKKCLNCGTMNVDQNNFCVNCGKTLTNVNENQHQFNRGFKCLKCGRVNTTDSKFCDNCGQLLKDNQQTDNKTKLICLIIVGLVVLLIFVGMMFGESSVDLENLATPSGFSIDSQNHSQIVLHDYGTPLYMIIVTSEDYLTPEELSNGFKKNNFILQRTNNIKLYNKDVKEETYIYENGHGHTYNYIIQFDNKKYSISCFTDSSNWNINNENNPVNKIINSMIKASK